MCFPVRRREKCRRVGRGSADDPEEFARPFLNRRRRNGQSWLPDRDAVQAGLSNAAFLTRPVNTAGDGRAGMEARELMFTSQPTDEILRAPESDHEFYGDLSRRYRVALNRYFVRRWPALHAEAEDLTQEVFARMIRGCRERTIEQIEGYIFQTASSVLIDRRRRRTVRHADQHDSFDEEGAHSIDYLTPDRFAEAREEVALVGRLLDALPERTRTAFVLNRFEEMTYPQIALHLGVSVSSVEKYIMHALRELSAGLSAGSRSPARIQ